MKAILTYHSIDPSGSPISVHPDVFARHVQHLASSGVRVVGLTDLAALPQELDAVALTFDDGFANFASKAWPLLRAAGMPATVFVVTQDVGGTNRWGGRSEAGIPELPLLSWEVLAELASEGVTIGSHTHSHTRLPGLSRTILYGEMRVSAEVIQSRVGVRPQDFCYPYGALDDAAVKAAQATFSRACTTEMRLLEADDHPALLPRLDAYYLQAPGRLESFGSPAFRRYVTARAWLRGVGSRARRLLARGGA